MAKLRKQIEQMAPAREVKRGSRRRFGLPSVAVVGYTNAGKSSLINRLTGSSELVENALFATLDTAVRGAQTAQGRNFTYVDTVGFVRKLPTQLVEAFKSTLEEVAQSDVIVHVVDASHPDPFSQIDAVNDVLEDIDSIAGMPTVIVFNKIDLIDDAALERLRQLAPEAFFVSAASSDGIEELNNYVESLLPAPSVRVEAVIPYNQGQLISQARENGIVHEIEYRNEGTYIVCEVDNVLAAALLAAHAQHGISEL